MLFDQPVVKRAGFFKKLFIRKHIMENEIWKPVVGYEGKYEVSNMGRVKSLDYNKTDKRALMKPQLCKGYLRVLISSNGKRKQRLIHRLVAQAFIPNPNNLPEVNHKDEDKTNNRVENLEWCDRSYNINYGTRNKRMSKINVNNPKISKPIEQYSIYYPNELIKVWPSISEIKRQLGYDDSLIGRVCSEEPKHKKYKTAYGFKWRYQSL